MPDISRSIEGGEIVFTASNPKATSWMTSNYQSTAVRFPAKQMPASVTFQEKAEQAGLSVGPIATPKDAQHAHAGV
jgi:hypothetical protein